jgi:hypothetical protein
MRAKNFKAPGLIPDKFSEGSDIKGTDKNGKKKIVNSIGCNYH